MRMQDDDQITHRFKNSDTAMRRAWIDLAVSRVREHLATAPSAGGFAAEQADELAAPAAPRPRLRLVRSGDPA